MKITILTMFPKLFDSFREGPVVQRAIRKGSLELSVVDIKEFAPGSFRHIDDSPFGGGAGMVMRCQPVLDALRSVRESAESFQNTIVAALSPAGRQFTQKQAHRFSELDHLILICGHYEGMDERIYRHVDEEISIGDYVLTGGEIAAMAVSDAVIRLLPGALRSESTSEESFENGLLEYPQYTQPAVYEGEAVPEVLTSGNHARIRRWRLKESLRRTMERRPDLLEGRQFTEEELALLEEIRKDAL
jgi:tRNA (guanine37-N1)-methyltransferase